MQAAVMALRRADLVGQQRALALAVREWRRRERQTALDGLLAGSLRFAGPRPVVAVLAMPDGGATWGGLLGEVAAKHNGLAGIAASVEEAEQILAGEPFEADGWRERIASHPAKRGSNARDYDTASIAGRMED